MKILVICLLVLLSSTTRGATGVVTDGKSLLYGLDLCQRGVAGDSLDCEETVIATSAASFTQSFAAACHVWETKFPNQCPFNLPSTLMATEFIKIAHNFLREHPDRIHESAESLLFDAIVAAFPRK